MFEEKLAKIDRLNEEILKYEPFINKTLIGTLGNYYHIRLTYTSNYIEGFTYSEEETFNLIFKDQQAPFKSVLEIGAVRGHDLCFKYMMELQNKSYIEEKDILKFHSLLSGGLENNTIAGQYRKGEVHIDGQLFLPHFRVPSAMKKLFDLLEEQSKILYPVLLAIRYHKDIIFIHPFMDGNGRVARLAMNTVLLQNKYLPIDITPGNRMNYHLSIKETYNNPVAFYEFMLSQAYESYNFMLDKLMNTESMSYDDRSKPRP